MTRRLFTLLLIITATSISFADTTNLEVTALLEKHNKGEAISSISNEDLKYLESSLAEKDFFKKSFSERRAIKAYSAIAMKYLDEKYSTSYYKYKNVIKGNDLALYEKALRVHEIEYLRRPYFYCSGGDLEEANLLRKKVLAIYKKDLPKVEKFREAINVCKYDKSNYYLLDEYYSLRDIKERNTLMLRLIEEDQKEYDFLYKNENELDLNFVNKYQEFLISGLSDEQISRDNLMMIVEKLLNEQTEVFNVDNRFYRVRSDGGVEYIDYPSALKAANAIKGLCSALEENGLGKSAIQIVRKFVSGSELQRIVKNETYFSEFSRRYQEYLQAPLP